MLARDGVVKLLDLGLARSETPAADDRSPWLGASGTADYLPPSSGTGRTPRIPADIYSLGCTLYHVLTGHPPFAGGPYKSVLSKMRAHQECRRRRLQDLGPMPAGSPPSLSGYWPRTRPTGSPRPRRSPSAAAVRRWVRRGALREDGAAAPAARAAADTPSPARG